MKAIPVLALSVAALALSGCSSFDKGPDTSSDEGGSIDARKYVENYESGSSDQSIAAGGSAAVRGPNPQNAPLGPADPGLLDEDTFVDAGTSGTISASTDPLSTFALDVDTGSYTVGRTLLREGVLPPAASIRPEEWVNAFRYADQAPTDNDLGLTVDSGVQPLSPDGTRLVRVGVSARSITDEDRPPVALTMVVDTSGSMDIRNRLGLVKSSLALLADHLRDDDTIAIVTYESSAHPLLEATPLSETDTIRHAIDALQPGGSTNLEAGLRTAYAHARASYRDDAINAVLLASDGVANVGTTSPDALVDQIVDGSKQGIHLVTVGFGMGNYNDDLMEQLADQGGGFYSYVDTFDEAKRLFVDDLTSTLTPVAKDAKAQVSFDPDAVTSYRLIGYDNRALDDDQFRDNSVDAGEIGAGHHVTALYEVQLTDGTEPGTPIGTATLRWRSVEDGMIKETSTDLTAATSESTSSQQLLLASTVCDLAELLKGTEQASARHLGLEDLSLRAAALKAHGVEGADDLVQMIDWASAAR